MAKLIMILKMFPHRCAVLWRRLIRRDNFEIETHEIPKEAVPEDLILLEQLDQLKKMMGE